MLSRVAENIYWLSRYMERAENTVRLVNTHSYMLLDMPTVSDHQGWIPLVIISGQDEDFAETGRQANEQTIVSFMLSEEKNAGSLLNGFKAVYNNLRCCRDIIPKSSYEAINSLCRFFIENVDNCTGSTAGRADFLRQVEDRLLAVSAGMNSNMSHDLAYRFMRMGCYLERADMTSRIIDVQSSPYLSGATAREDILVQQQRWIAVLKTLSAFQMYRQHVRHPVNGVDTLSFLLNDRQLPRSYYFCLIHLEHCLDELENDASVREAITTLKYRLINADTEKLANDPAGLHQFLDSLQLGMLDVGSAIASTYFPPPPAQDR
ncbi:MAG: alpha-E domain-containing protein [Granulosicoccus sp.]